MLSLSLSSSYVFVFCLIVGLLLYCSLLSTSAVAATADTDTSGSTTFSSSVSCTMHAVLEQLMPWSGFNLCMCRCFEMNFSDRQEDLKVSSVICNNYCLRSQHIVYYCETSYMDYVTRNK